MLDFCDEEVVEALQFHLRDLAVTFRFREVVEAVEVHDGGSVALLGSGKAVAADVVMYSAGRQGATDSLDLETIGITPDKRGRIPVDEHYRTNLGHIYAVGDVIGFPALASTSMEQGRLAAYHAFDEPTTAITGTMRDQLRRPDGGGTDRPIGPLRGRDLPLPRTGSGPDLR
jgi:NAD(P) transhydrogenase